LGLQIFISKKQAWNADGNSAKLKSKVATASHQKQKGTVNATSPLQTPIKPCGGSNPK
jgi:hypothetical protein